MEERSRQMKWIYLDYWDQISPQEFTNTAIHMSPVGSQQFAEMLLQDILFYAEESITER